MRKHIKHSTVPMPYYARNNAVFTNKTFVRDTFSRDASSVELQAANYVYGLNTYFRNKPEFVHFWRNYGKNGVIKLWNAMRKINGDRYAKIYLRPVPCGNREFMFFESDTAYNEYRSHDFDVFAEV